MCDCVKRELHAEDMDSDDDKTKYLHLLLE